MMVHFGIVCKDSDKAREIASRLNSKLESNLPTHMFINGFALSMNKDNDYFIFIQAKSLMNNSLFIYSLITILAIMLIFKFISTFLLILCFLLLFLIFFSQYMFFIFTLVRMRRFGIKGRIKILNGERLMERLATWVKERY